MAKNWLRNCLDPKLRFASLCPLSEQPVLDFLARGALPLELQMTGKGSKRHLSLSTFRTDSGWEPYGSGRLPGGHGRCDSLFFFHQQACRATLGLTWGLEHQALGTSLLLCIETSAKADWEWHWSRLELSNFSTCCYNTESFQCEVDWNKIV